MARYTVRCFLSSDLSLATGWCCSGLWLSICSPVPCRAQCRFLVLLLPDAICCSKPPPQFSTVFCGGPSWLHIYIYVYVHIHIHIYIYVLRPYPDVPKHSLWSAGLFGRHSALVAQTKKIQALAFDAACKLAYTYGWVVFVPQVMLSERAGKVLCNMGRTWDMGFLSAKKCKEKHWGDVSHRCCMQLL